MEEYGKQIPLKFKAEIDVPKKTQDELQKNFVKDFGKGLKQEFKLSVDGQQFASYVKSGIQAGGALMISGLKKLFSEAWEELSNILSYSKLSNQRTRDLAFTYGFSASEGYAFDKAMGIMGYQSEEDLMYMNSQEQEQFREAFSKYSEKYSELYDSGFFKDLQEYQYEMSNFKEEVTMEVVEFFMDNKDTIKKLMYAAMDFFEFVVKALGFIVEGFSGDYSRSDSARLAATNEIINQSSTKSTTNINVKQDNTYHNVDSQSKQWLTDVSNISYEQIITALGG